jgi:hypothetical protein
MKRAFLGILLLSLCVALPSRAATPATTQATADALHEHCFLLHLPGIGGKRSIDRALVLGLERGGVDADFDIYDWTGGPDQEGLPALANNQHHREEADKIAKIIVDQATKHPDIPIVLTSHSGGCGLAVWALEQLPDNITIDNFVMLQSALSPQYDLTKALKHVRGKLYVFSSLNDTLVLGTGTRMFGTIDRVQTDAAGRVGFTMPKKADAQQYAKLISIPYQKAWLRYDDIGDHIGPMNVLFAKAIIAPLLLTGEIPKLAMDAETPSGSVK